ncbi:hypothetical protein GGR21_000681 [Dysgonomonas hofstadii]|uniref:Uncharacterized protein n=1 Tax=Dysgonomonas hofstadii TaxID=637886 RepID=A0A840CMQ2_9BACT|nr:hypothetical protein [Dysgonomonas hofstadii]MBB4034794.1 hypothetical protein [Dysgonomonas hofstadii]
MAQTVSNDALWEKLSEIDKKFEKFIVMQESQAVAQEQNRSTPGFEEAKDVIIAEIREQVALLSRHNNDHFGANRQNIEVLNKNILLAVKHSIETKDQLKTDMESLKEDKKIYFNFKLFKIRKISLMIAILGLLVFILTLFSMKQQNDYALLLEEYYRQSNTTEQQKEVMKTK